MTEIEKLEARISNLEIALHALYEIISDILPPEIKENAYNMLNAHYLLSSELDGFKGIDFIGAGK